MKKTRSEHELPVFPNWYPYNDMLLDGRLRVGDFGVKTRSYNWDYKGPVLLYNSGRTAWHCVNIYDYKRGHKNHGIIIGVGELVNVRLLSDAENIKMICNFNNLTKRDIARHGFTGVDVQPLPFGYFFSNLKRFQKPVPFSWPSGPVKPIFTDVRKNRELSRQLSLARRH